MKKYFFFTLLLAFSSCNNTPTDASQIDLTDFKQKISYALGADEGTNFQNVPDAIFSQLNKKEIKKGFKDYLTHEKSTNTLSKVLSSALVSPNGVDTSKYSIDSVSYCYGGFFGNLLRHSLTTKRAMSRINIDVATIGFGQAMIGADSLIDLKERNKMIVDFNNDLNKLASHNFIDSIKKVNQNNIQPEGYVFVEEAKGNGEKLNPDFEYRMILSIENIGRDTIISTLVRGSNKELYNAKVLNSDSPLLPKIWKKAIQKMEVGGKYTLYIPYEQSFGEKGIQNPAPPYNYVIQPYQAIILHVKILDQNPRFTAVKEAGKNVIDKAKQQPNTYVDQAGYVLTTLREGDGEQVKKGADVQAQYILTNAEGNIVENSYIRSQRTQQPAPTFSLNRVIKGWKMAIPKMKVGGHYILVLPADLAYGEKGNPGVGPYETLTFDIAILQTGPAGSLVKNQSPTQMKQFSKEDLERLQKQLKQQ